jgi:hypothetical protein
MYAELQKEDPRTPSTGGKRVFITEFITDVKGTFFGMSESGEASKRR